MAKFPELTAAEIEGQPAKVGVNWKFVQVSEHEEVCVCCYDKNTNERTSSSTSVVSGVRIKGRGCIVVKTASGSLWLLKDAEKVQSLWPLGIQAKRPELYASLQEANLI